MGGGGGEGLTRSSLMGSEAHSAGEKSLPATGNPVRSPWLGILEVLMEPTHVQFVKRTSVSIKLLSTNCWHLGIIAAVRYSEKSCSLQSAAASTEAHLHQTRMSDSQALSQMVCRPSHAYTKAQETLHKTDETCKSRKEESRVGH